MQDNYNLLAEEEREMIPLCLDQGVGTIVSSPLARGWLTWSWDEARATSRAETDAGYADLLYTPTNERSDRAIVDAVARSYPRAGSRGLRWRSPGSAASRW